MTKDEKEVTYMNFWMEAYTFSMRAEVKLEDCKKNADQALADLKEMLGNKEA